MLVFSITLCCVACICGNSSVVSFIFCTGMKSPYCHDMDLFCPCMPQLQISRSFHFSESLTTYETALGFFATAKEYPMHQHVMSGHSLQTA